MIEASIILVVSLVALALHVWWALSLLQALQAIAHSLNHGVVNITNVAPKVNPPRPNLRRDGPSNPLNGSV